VHPDYVEVLEKHGLVFSGRSPNHPIMQVLELPADRHPFFLATQAHPELMSRPLDPHPMFTGVVRAALVYSGVSVDSLPSLGECGSGRPGSVSAAATRC